MLFSGYDKPYNICTNKPTVREKIIKTYPFFDGPPDHVFSFLDFTLGVLFNSLLYGFCFITFPAVLLPTLFPGHPERFFRPATFFTIKREVQNGLSLAVSATKKKSLKTKNGFRITKAFLTMNIGNTNNSSNTCNRVNLQLALLSSDKDLLLIFRLLAISIILLIAFLLSFSEKKLLISEKMFVPLLLSIGISYLLFCHFKYTDFQRYLKNSNASFYTIS